LTNADSWFCKTFKKYRGITFVIEKEKPVLKRTFEKGVAAKDFIYQKVELYKVT
jgi:hypothetical protein